jgi:hypothetical protein
MKKYAIRTRIAVASTVRAHWRARSGSRLSGERSRTERPPLMVVALADT